MRIIAGEAKGRKLVSPRGPSVRPTKDSVREAIFSILGEQVPGRLVLDGYAGTGAMGLEALSRGAARAFFVDSSRKAISAIEKNIDLCGFGDRSDFHFGTLRGFLETRLGRNQKFDLVFLDPPYGDSAIEGDLRCLGRVSRLTGGARIVLEYPSLGSLPHLPESFKEVDNRRYGNTGLMLLRFDGNP